MEKVLYVVFTPYQLLLASSLSKQMNHDADLLVVQDTISKKMLEGSRHYFSTINEIYFHYPHKTNSKYEIFQLYTKFYHLVNQSLKSREYSIVVGSSEGSLLVRIVLSTLRNKFAYWHLEDGSFDYSNNTEPKHIKEELITHYLRFRFAPSRIRSKQTTPGTAKWIQRCYFTNPNQVRFEILKQKQKIQSIDFGILHSTLRFYAEDIEDLEYDYIISLDHSSSSDNTKVVFNEIVRELSTNGFRVAIKYHPREINKYIEAEVDEIDAKIPLEFILPHYKKTIIAGASTVLLTSHLLYPSLNLVYIGGMINYHAPVEQFESLLKAFSIPFAQKHSDCITMNQSEFRKDEGIG